MVWDKALARILQKSAIDVRAYQHGPAALVVLRHVLNDAAVRVVMKRLGVNVPTMIADIVSAITVQAANREVLEQSFSEIVDSMVYQAAAARTKQVQPLQMLVPLAKTPPVAAMFENHGVARYALTWHVCHDAWLRRSWWKRKLEARQLTKLPPLQGDQRHLLMHNDDHTPLAFVQAMLQQYVGMSDEDAVKTAEAVHHSGWQRIATLSLADTAALLATIEDEAKTNDFPLRLSVYPSLPAARVVTRR
jgi:ATP-dependent Clp protease adapter protein ClpS